MKTEEFKTNRSQIIIFLCVLFTIVWNANGAAQINRNTSQLDSLLNQLSFDSTFEFKTVGRGIRSKKYETFLYLRKIVDDTSLFKLTKHENKIIQIYAYWSFVESDPNKAYEIFIEHKRDKYIIHQQNGCIGSYNEVRFIMAHLLLMKIESLNKRQRYHVNKMINKYNRYKFRMWKADKKERRKEREKKQNEKEKNGI